MAKYIYDNKKLRCRLKYGKLFGNTEMQLQKKGFLFWTNCFELVTVAEDHWHGQRDGVETMNPCVMGYMMGGYHEGWLPGTLNIKRRALELFKEYYAAVLYTRKQVEKFKSIEV